MAESSFRQEKKAAEDAIKLISEAPAPAPVIVVDDKNAEAVLAEAEAQMAVRTLVMHLSLLDISPSFFRRVRCAGSPGRGRCGRQGRCGAGRGGDR